jgi:hypothetical protein
MQQLFRIKKEHSNEDSLYYHIDKVAIEEKDGDMVKVFDIDDGNSFWINSNKLELA